jgi:rubrerythrin
MAKIKQQDKEKIIGEFETMKAIEASARDLYIRISSDPRVEDESIKNTFKIIAKEEEQHVELVQKIIDIVNISL